MRDGRLGRASQAFLAPLLGLGGAWITPAGGVAAGRPAAGRVSGPGARARASQRPERGFQERAVSAGRTPPPSSSGRPRGAADYISSLGFPAEGTTLDWAHVGQDRQATAFLMFIEKHPWSRELHTLPCFL